MMSQSRAASSLELAALHLYAHGVGHRPGEGLAAFRSAAKGLHTGYISHLGDGFQLGWRLAAGTYDPHPDGAGVREVFDSHAGGGAGAQLAETIGLSIEKQPAGLGVVEAHLKGVLPFDHGVGLDAQQSLVEEAAAHHRKHAGVRDNLATGEIHRLAGAIVTLHRLDGVDHSVHGHTGANVIVP